MFQNIYGLVAYKYTCLELVPIFVTINKNAVRFWTQIRFLSKRDPVTYFSRFQVVSFEVGKISLLLLSCGLVF